MARKDYQRAFSAAKHDLAELLHRRQTIDQRIARLVPLLKELATQCDAKVPSELWHDAAPENIRSMGITDAVRLALKTSPRPMRPKEVAEQLEKWGFGVSEYSNVLASIHTILKRLVKSGEATELPTSGKRSYKRVSEVSGVLSGLEGIERGGGFKESLIYEKPVRYRKQKALPLSTLRGRTGGAKEQEG